MTNVLDMIDEGTTDQPPIVKKAAGIWKRFGKRRSEDNDVPLQRKTSKVLKNVSVRDFKSSSSGSKLPIFVGGKFDWCRLKNPDLQYMSRVHQLILLLSKSKWQ